jgi:hypothetical protein
MQFQDRAGGNAKVMKIENYVDAQGVYDGQENLYLVTRMDDVSSGATPINAGNLNKANFKDNDCLEFKPTVKTINQIQQTSGVVRIYCAADGHIWLIPPSGEKIDLTAMRATLAAVKNDVDAIKGYNFDTQGTLQASITRMGEIITGTGSAIKLKVSEINMIT